VKKNLSAPKKEENDEAFFDLFVAIP